MGKQRSSARRSLGWSVTGAAVVVLLGGACTGDPSITPSASPAGSGTTVPAGAATAAPGAPGIPIPPPTTVATTQAPVVTTPEGGPAVVDLVVPDTFTCLADGVEAQVTVGWSAPSATGLTILLDGTSPPSGIQDTMPYQVPAGTAAGIGSTIVFPCDSGTEHTLTMTWSMGTETTERTFTITEAEATP